MGTPYWVTVSPTIFPWGRATAWCNEGDYVLGGGYQALALWGVVNTSHPVQDGSTQGWEVGDLPPGSTVYAICANIEEPY